MTSVNLFLLPNLAWNAWLLTFEPSFEFHTVKNEEQFNFCQSAERGGLSQCRMPWIKANIEGKAGYKVNLPKSRIHYTDVNSLYASAMRYYLLVGNFEKNLFHQTTWDKKNNEVCNQHMRKI